jgi:hypothetical protein
MRGRSCGSRCAWTPRRAGEDVIDEALNYFRANVLFRKYDVKGTRTPRVRRYTRTRTHAHAPDSSRGAGSSDKLLIYLTLYISACLRKLESAPTLAAGTKAVFNLAMEPFALPGDAGWPLGGLFTPPANREEAGACGCVLSVCAAGCCVAERVSVRRKHAVCADVCGCGAQTRCARTSSRRARRRARGW